MENMKLKDKNEDKNRLFGSSKNISPSIENIKQYFIE